MMINQIYVKQKINKMKIFVMQNPKKKIRKKNKALIRKL